MSAVPGNVRALRPISILLASDDWTRMEYSYYVLKGNGLDEPTVMRAINTAKRRFYLRPAYLSADTNIDVALVRYGSNIFVLDADDALPRGARSATTFAALHPDIPVVLVVEGASVRSVSGLLLLDKWRSTERLLGEIELAFLGFRP